MTEPQSVTAGWRSVGMCGDGEVFDMEGLNPWEHELDSQSEQIVVAHPFYPSQRHDVNVWVTHAPDRVVLIVAGEMSNGAWALFLPCIPRPATDAQPAGM
jgi:hypothetical protein